MEKKIFVNPTVKLVELETSAMICGSGTSNARIGLGSTTGGSSAAPTSTSQGGLIGIICDAKSGSGFCWK